MQFKEWEETMRAIVKGEKKDMVISIEKFKKEIEDGGKRFCKLELSDLMNEF